MKIFLLCFIAVAISFYAVSQDAIIKKLQNDVTSSTVKKEIKDTSTWTWKSGGQVSLNLNQGSLSNWAAGGDKFALSVNNYINYFLFYRKGKQNWDNNIDFNFGLVKTTSLGTRKNDDRLDVLSKYGYRISEHWYLSTLFNFRTQFFNGYSYPSPDKRVLSSAFLSPAYILLSEGFDFKPNTHFSAFISPITSRWIVVASRTLSDSGAYGVPRGEHSITEIGAFASVNYQNSFSKNVSYKGRLDMFSNYRNKPGNVDVFMTNYFAFKINRFLSTTYNLDLIYDDDAKLFGKDGKTPGLQLKSLIGIGFLLRY